ncbi:hypothetical protein B0H17DRAFT_379023 [Mycena rosella]|uniref:MYND-type domain-containing protein n=1 Tax=Mycena rosella TaxID=1033263 RepID=A0AAD7G0P7_MYCRO|nr:hypothetical protein B0H17DRAFT_379023 [Mycena rosella]
MPAPGKIISPYIQPVFESLRDPFNSPYCHATYNWVLSEYYSEILKAKNSADALLQDIAKSLIMFFATPVDSPARHIELEARLFRRPCRCLSIFPQLYPIHGPAPLRIETQGHDVRDLDSLVTFFAEATDRIISATEVSDKGAVRAWRRQLKERVNAQCPALVRSFSHWLTQKTGPRVFALFGTLADLSSWEMMFQVDASDAIRSAFASRMHQLVANEVLDTSGTRSWRIDLIFHGAGCFAEAAMDMFNYKQDYVAGRVPSGAKAARFRACFEAEAQGMYDDICSLLSMTSRASEEIKSGALLDVIRLAFFGRSLYDVLPPPRKPLSPLIHQGIQDAQKRHTHPGWSLFKAYFHIMDRCSNHLRHSSARAASTPAASFQVMYKDRVKPGERLLACSGCKASHYCSKECQKESWKAKTMAHREFCPIISKIFQVHQGMSRSSGGSKDWENMYRAAGITDAEVDKAMSYIVMLMEHFSSYED